MRFVGALGMHAASIRLLFSSRLLLVSLRRTSFIHFPTIPLPFQGLVRHLWMPPSPDRSKLVQCEMTRVALWVHLDSIIVIVSACRCPSRPQALDGTARLLVVSLVSGVAGSFVWANGCRPALSTTSFVSSVTPTLVSNQII